MCLDDWHCDDHVLAEAQVEIRVIISQRAGNSQMRISAFSIYLHSH